MSNALQTRHAILPAQADVAVRLSLTLFLLGPLRAHTAALDALWVRFRALPSAQRLLAYRVGNEDKWRTLGAGEAPAFSERFGFAADGPGARRVEMAELPEPGIPAKGTHAEWLDLPPVRDMPRASHIRFLFDDAVNPAEITALGDWAVQNLPLWWGAGGYSFEYTSGSPYIAGKRIAALAKRHWAVQLQDLTSLQWEALKGMPSVNWLTLLGPAFVAQAGMDLEALASTAAQQAGVFVRRGPHGIALAAGPRPITGDINTQDDLGPYTAVARLLAPLLLRTHRPLDGPLVRPEVLAAWLSRFDDPQAWLDADLST